MAHNGFHLNRRITLCGILFLALVVSVRPQKKTTERDSLKRLLIAKTPDSMRLATMVALSLTYYPNQMDSFDLNIKKIKAFGKKTGNAQAQAEALHLLGIAHRKNKEYPEAIQKDSMALKIFEESGNLQKQMEVKKSMGATYSFSRAHKNALTCYKNALELAKGLNDHENIVNISINMAIVYTALTRYENALDIVLQQTALVEQGLITPKFQIKYHSILGSIYSRIEENGKSLAYFKKAYALSVPTEYYDDQIVALSNLSYLYDKENDYTRAKESIYKALDIIEQRDLEKRKPAILGMISSLHMERGEYEKSSYYLSESLAIAEKKKDTFAMANVYCSLGKSYVKGKAFTKGKADLERAKLLFSALAMNQEGFNIRSEIFKSLSLIDSALGDATSSLNYYKKYIAFRDSLKIKEQKQHMEEMELAHESDKKDREIELLSAENEVQHLKADQERNVRAGLIIGGLLVLLLLGVTYSRYRTKNRAIATIEDQKRAIEGKSHENEMLIKEIHHRVKNNLQIISSLLSAHSSSTGYDDKVDRIIMESQNRIRSMALIHQSLYASNNFSKVDTTSYFNDLIENLGESYAHTHKHVRFESDIQAGEIKMDLAVPLGLIINELTTNAFKYAFKGSRMDSVISIGFRMTADGESFELEVSDNGQGLPDGFDMETTESFGLQMVRGLVEQLKGNIVIADTEGHGTRFEILISYREAA